MPTPEVIEKLRQLRTALAAPEPEAPAHASLRQQLDEVLVDPEQRPRYTGLAEKLRGAMIGLEVDHPHLAGSIEAVINSLSAAGI